MSDAKTILIVDDSESDRWLFRRYIQNSQDDKYCVLEAETIKQGLDIWRSQKPDVVLIDFNLTDGNGLDFLEAVRANILDLGGKEALDLKLPVIMLTGNGDERVAVRAMKLGVYDYLVKSDVTEFSLLQSIRSLLDLLALKLKLGQAQKREILVSQIALNIHRFLDLEDICQAIVQDICKFLSVDRTLIYKFNEDMSRRIIAEAVVEPWQSCLNFVSEDGCLDPLGNQAKEYQVGKIIATSDIYTSNFANCHVQMLERFQIRANIVVPIVLSESVNNSSRKSTQPLWGLLIVNQCAAPRIWQDEEIQLLQQLSIQLAIAIQKAEIYQNLQNLNNSLEQQIQKRTSQLQASEYKTRTILTSLPDIINIFDANGIYLESIINNIDYDIVPKSIDRVGKSMVELLPEKIALRQLQAIRQAVSTGENQDFVQVLETDRGLNYEEVRVIPFQKDAVIIIVRDISDRKIAEEKIQRQSQRTQVLAEVTLKIRQSLKIEEILQTTVTEIRRVFDVDRALIFQLQPDGSGIILKEALSDRIENIVESIFDRHLDDPCFRLQYSEHYRNGRFSKIENVDTDELAPCHAEFLRQLGVKANIVVPIVQPDKLWGLLVVHQCDRPRRWTDAEIELMQQLSNQVAIALTQSQLVETLQKSEEQRRLAIDLNHIGCWDFDVVTGLADWNQNHFELMGLNPSDAKGSYLTWRDRVHPDDLGWVEAAFGQALENHTELEVEYRIVHPKGDTHWVLTKGKGIYDNFGKAIRMVGVMIDISDRKQIAIALEKELIRNQTIFSNCFDGIFVMDNVGNVIESNLSFASMLGYELEETTKLTVYDIDARWTREELRRGIEEFQHGKKTKFETRMRKKDGSICNVEVSGNSVRTESDEFIFSICRDITQRKLAEAALRRQDQEVRTLIENAPDIIDRYDRDFRHVYINPVVETFTGLSPKYFIGKTNHELGMNEYMTDLTTRLLSRVFETGKPDTMEYEFLGLNGIRHFQARLVPEFDDRGTVVSVLTISRDITEKKINEQSLRQKIQREQMLNQLLQTIRISLDLSEIFNSATQTISSLLALEQAAISQYIPEQKIWKYIAAFREAPEIYDKVGLEIPDEGNPFAAKIKQLEIVQVNDTAAVRDEINLVNPEINQRKSGAWLIVPIVVNGQAWGTISLRKLRKVVRWEDYEIEISQTIANQLAIAIQQVNFYEQLQQELAERKQREVDLAHAKELAEAANRAKSEFLANMSHEIRTPMNGVIGVAQLLASTPLTDEQKNLLKIILDSGDALLTVINDILDFSKIESGNLQLESQEFDFRDTLNSACNLFSKQAADKNISLQYQVKNDIPARLLGDSSRLRQVFINLIGNAIKFTKQGSVSIEIDGKFTTPTSYEFRFAIADTGIGIDRDRIEKLFRPFMQADASINRQFGGTGLGLAICKRLIELMGGTIWVESHGNVGGNPPPDWVAKYSDDNIKGSTFHFAIALPVICDRVVNDNQSMEKTDAFAPINFEINADFLPIKILLVEDNQFNQKITSLMLKKLGYETDVVVNGQEAIAAQLEQEYDFIFMDIQMPVMDGMTATKIIRDNSSSNKKPWIVALTANSLLEEFQACIDVGMNDYISKPFTVKDLVRSLSQYANERESES